MSNEAAREEAGAHPVLVRMRAIRPELRPSEQRIADLFLADPAGTRGTLGRRARAALRHLHHLGRAILQAARLRARAGAATTHVLRDVERETFDTAALPRRLRRHRPQRHPGRHRRQGLARRDALPRRHREGTRHESFARLGGSHHVVDQGRHLRRGREFHRRARPAAQTHPYRSHGAGLVRPACRLDLGGDPRTGERRHRGVAQRCHHRHDRVPPARPSGRRHDHRDHQPRRGTAGRPGRYRAHDGRPRDGVPLGCTRQPDRAAHGGRLHLHRRRPVELRPLDGGAARHVRRRAPRGARLGRDERGARSGGAVHRIRGARRHSGLRARVLPRAERRSGPTSAPPSPPCSRGCWWACWSPVRS